MDGSRLLTPLLVAALAGALVAPAATAHTSAFSADGRVRASVGLLNEPVVTYKDTGLDLCFTHNTTAPRTPLANVDPAALTATLKSPGGQTMTAPLEAQFGRAGCFTFEHPLVLTQAGVYKLDLNGSINGTTFQVTDQVVGSADGIAERESVTWPDEDVATNLELQQRIEALEADAEASDGKGAPLPAAAWLVVGLAALAAVRRLR